MDMKKNKKPSKVELKLVIESLKKDDCELSQVKKAVRYIPYYLKSEGLTKKLLKEVIRLWAESREKVRVICLLCLVRVFNRLKDKQIKQSIVKKLYNTFLNKCRVTKQETMSMIGFMRHSLIELYRLDSEIALKQAQQSCQQLNITLKNAKTHKNEETYKTVLNWQFANCLILLSGLIVSHDDNSSVKSLTRDVIQLNLGAMDLLFSPRYYPFYCHLIDNLIDLSVSSGLFIPVLPLIMSIINKIEIPHKLDADKRGQKDSPKPDDAKVPKEDDSEVEGSDDEEDEESEDDQSKKGKKNQNKFNMDLLNHVTIDEAHSLEYKLSVIDKLYELMVKYLASQSHKIAFPELILLSTVQLKKWLKKTHKDHSQKFRILLEKMKSDADISEKARGDIDFAFTDYAAVDAWEKRMKDSNQMVLPRLINQ